MPYTDAVIKETMRKHGIVDGIWRKALEDLEIQGRLVPKVCCFSRSTERMHVCLRHPMPSSCQAGVTTRLPDGVWGHVSWPSVFWRWEVAESLGQETASV